MFEARDDERLAQDASIISSGGGRIGMAVKQIIESDQQILELLSASVERYRIVIHAYVLMATQYALIQMPEANLSFAM